MGYSPGGSSSQTPPKMSFFQPSGPVSTSSTSAIMAGLGISYTPVTSGKLLVAIVGNAGASAGPNTVTVQGRYGTGAAPTGPAAAINNTNVSATGSAATTISCPSHGIPAGGGNVIITGVVGATTVNGTWTATYVDANNYTIPLANSTTATGLGSSQRATPVSVVTGMTGFPQGNVVCDPKSAGTFAHTPFTLLGLLGAGVGSGSTALLTVGTAYWFDLSYLAAVSNDPAVIGSTLTAWISEVT